MSSFFCTLRRRVDLLFRVSRRFRRVVLPRFYAPLQHLSLCMEYSPRVWGMNGNFQKGYNPERREPLEKARFSALLQGLSVHEEYPPV